MISIATITTIITIIAITITIAITVIMNIAMLHDHYDDPHRHHHYDNHHPHHHYDHQKTRKTQLTQLKPTLVPASECTQGTCCANSSESLVASSG